MLYQIKKPIRAYNGELETVYYVSEEGLENLFSPKYIKQLMYQCDEDIELTGNPLEDLKLLGYVVIEKPNGVVEI